MNTASRKIQLTLSSQEVQSLAMKGQQMGYNIPKYIRFLIGKDVEKNIETIPTFPMSSRLEKRVIKALKDHKQGKSKTLDEVEDLLSE